MAHISEIEYKEIKNTKRIDAEYFKPDYIKIQNAIKTFGSKTINQLGCELDCSAFYPAITDKYNFNKKGIPFLRVNEIQNGLLSITPKTAFLPNTIIEQYSSNIKMAFPGDLIIAKGGNSLAKVGLLTDEFQKYSVCRDLIIVRTQNIELIDKYYLWLFLHSAIGQKIMLRTACQTGQPHLTIKEIKNLSIPINTKSQLICKEYFMKSSDKNIESKRLYKEAEEALLNEVNLINYEPEHSLCFTTTKKEIDSATRIDAEYFQPKYNTIIEKVEEYHSGYDVIKNIVEFEKGIEVGSNEYTKSGVPFVRVSDFSKFGFDKSSKTISYREYDRIKNKFQPTLGDILITKDGTIGISYVVKEYFKGILSSAFLRLKLKNKYKSFDKECLSLILNSIICQMQVNKLSGGALIAHLKPSDFEQFKIPLIRKEIQREVTKKLELSFILRKESKELLHLARKEVIQEIEDHFNS